MAPSGDRPAWFVGIKRTKEAAPEAAGFLFADGHVLTCAHAVETEPGRTAPTSPLWGHFAFCDAPAVELAVVPEGWFPDDDVAVLRLVDAAPAGAVPAPLASARSLSGHACTAHGYPKGQEWEATPARVSVAGLTGKGRISVSSESERGFSFEPGYSGSPLWDHALNAVIGMVAQRVRPRAAVKGGPERDIRAAFAVSVEAMARLWPPLAASVTQHSAAEEADEAEDDFESLAELLDDANQPPVVSRADIYDLGVSVSKYTRRERGTAAPAGGAEVRDEYVPRPGIDEALDRAFAEHDFVIAVGDSASGKTRSMVELLRRRVPGARVIVPSAEPTAPVKLSRLDLGSPDGVNVLWLDDIHRFLGLNGIDLKTLDRLRKQNPPVKVVGTLTGQRFREIQSRRGEDNASRMPSLVLNRAAIVDIPSRSDSDELASARAHYPDEDFSERGIGQTLVAAAALDDMYLHGRTAEPYGWAVLQAAIDWQRTGLDTAAGRSALRRMAGIYLTEEQRAGFGEPEFAAALRWATTVPAGSVVAPMRTVPDARGDTTGGGTKQVGSRAPRHVVELASGNREGVQGRRVPEAAWDFVIDECAGADLLRIAFTLLSADGEDYAWAAGRALAAAEKALETSDGDPETAAYARLLSGYLQGRAGKLEKAIELLEAAQGSGIADVESAARLELAGALFLAGDLNRAEVLLWEVSAAPDPGTAAVAKAGLAGIMYQRGQVDQALTQLEELLAIEDEASAEVARTTLAGIVGASARGAAGEPKTLINPRRAARWRPSDASVRGAVQPIAAVPAAAVALSGILMEQGDLDRARDLLRQADQSRDFQSGPTIEAALGLLATADGTPDEAEGYLRAALESGDFTASAMARISLAQIAVQRGDRAAARAMLEPVADGNHAYYGPMASVLLGELLIQDGERDAALHRFYAAYTASQFRWHYAAGNALAAIYLVEDLGDEHGRQLLAETADCQFPDLSARASDMMGDLLATRGDFQGAKDFYQDAINSGDPYWAQMARVDLAILIADKDRDFDRAAGLLTEAVEAGDSMVAGGAQLVLGLVELERERIAEGIGWLRTASESAHPAIAEPAHVYLAIGLAIDSGDLRPAIEVLDRLWRWIEAEDFTILDGDVSGAVADTAGAASGTGTGTGIGTGAGTAPGTGTAPADPEPGELADADLAEAYLAHCDRFIELGDVGVPHAAALLEVIVDGDVAADVALLAGAGLRYGWLLMGAGDLEWAGRVLQDVVDSADPATEPAARYALAEVLFRREELEAAYRCLMPLAAGALGSAGEDHRPAAYRLQARILAAQGDTVEAVRWFVLAAEAAPDDATRQEIAEELAEVRRMPENGTSRSHRPLAGSFEILDGLGGLDGLSGLGGADRADEPDGPDGQSFEVVGQRVVVPGPALPATVVYLLGRVALGEGADAEARRWLAKARAADDAEVAARADAALTELDAEAGAEAGAETGAGVGAEATA